MTTSDYRKVLKQLKAKPAKMKRFSKFNTPKVRSCGRQRFKCDRCGRTGQGGRVSSYGLNLCRCCFRDIATKIGFKKYN
jgi:small subunit ribosomal protein S14